MVEPSQGPSRSERFRRLLDDQGRMFMVPMDHGASIGPVTGVTAIKDTLSLLADSATCTTVHKGMLQHALPYAGRMGVLMHLSASTDHAPDPDDKRIVGTVQEAVALGADGVSVHLNLGSATEANQIEAIGKVSTDCNYLGVPIVAMVYPRGPRITNPFDSGLVAHAARLGAELGADAVKVPCTDDPSAMRAVVKGAGIPVIIAGGPKADDREAFLTRIRGAAEAGVAGVSIGRNVFQTDNPAQAMRDIIACFP